MKYAWFSLALILSALAAWGVFGLNRHLIAAVDAWKNAAPDLKPTLEAISGPRGTLHEADKAIVKIGDAVVTTQLQERRIAPATIAAVNSLVSIAPHANAAMDSASGTAEALTATAQSATETLAEGQRTIAAAQPLLKSYTQSGADLDALLKQKSITDTLANIDGTTRNFQDVTGDFAKVTHKASDDYLAPKPWYRKVGRYASDAFDFGALVARHY